MGFLTVGFGSNDSNPTEDKPSILKSDDPTSDTDRDPMTHKIDHLASQLPHTPSTAEENRHFSPQHSAVTITASIPKPIQPQHKSKATTGFWNFLSNSSAAT
ncbi:hypothetical protein SLE2022_308290 [Rubroshorea leprosula]